MIHSNVLKYLFQKSYKIRCVKNKIHCVTALNAVISPNFLMWKFWGKAQFPYSFDGPKLYGDKISTPGNYNLGQNVWILFHVLAQFLFPTSETELDYYQQKVIRRVASQAAERLNT